MREAICKAIQSKSVISFQYQGSQRQAEPHLLGYKKDGNLVLSAFQLSGGSGVDWRDFLLSKMSALSTTAKRFQSARPGYNRDDHTMSEILCRL
jgi:predicted DNA-binding transcriptional regulator YafY